VEAAASTSTLLQNDLDEAHSLNQKLLDKLSEECANCHLNEDLKATKDELGTLKHDLGVKIEKFMALKDTHNKFLKFDAVIDKRG
jgi:hypothetical protein